MRGIEHLQPDLPRIDFMAKNNNADVSSLIEQAVSGDQVAMRRLLFFYHARLSSTIEPMIGDKLRATIDADDILQETFAQAFKDIHTFQAKQSGSFFGWLKTIASNRVRDAARHVNRKKRGGEQVRVNNAVPQNSTGPIDLLLQISDGGQSPSGVVAVDEAAEALREAIQNLPDDQRLAIQMHCIEGLTLDETAKQMDRTSDSVRGLIQRGKKQLKEQMRKSSMWFSR